MISIIAAIGKNRELGRDNKLLWSIPEDMKRFKNLTTGHVVIMGQKTFESIGRKLPNRENIVLTHDRKFKADGCEICFSVNEALEIAKKSGEQEVFVIGGGQIYRQFLSVADKLYLTVVDKEEKNADTYFPDYSDFVKTKEVGSGEFEEIKYKFLELTKNA